MYKLYSLLLFLLAVSCWPKKNNCGFGIHYGFKFPLSITPKDTFSIGDTIWYEMNLPNQLLDENSGNYVDFTDYELFFDFTASKADTNFIYDATHLFDIYAEIGNVTTELNYFVYTYFHFKSINEKHFKIGLIPTKKGCYNTAISLANIFFRKEENNELDIVETDCWEHLRPDTYAFTNNGQSNYYLVDGICQYSPYDSLVGCYEDSIQHLKGAYAFCVVE